MFNLDSQIVDLRRLEYKLRKKIPETFLQNMRVSGFYDHMLYSMVLEVCSSVLAEKKEDLIPVTFDYEEYNTVWDHIKDCIRKNKYLSKILNGKIEVKKVKRGKMKVVRLEQYILYPSLDINREGKQRVYKMNYSIAD